MKKKLMLLLFTFVILLTAAGTAHAAPVVYIDNDEITFEVPPVIENGRTLVPLRAIFEELGADVTWNGVLRTVTANSEGNTIVLTINSNVAYINGKSVNLEVPAKIRAGRTLVPLRFVSEALGAYVGWDSSSEIVNILSDEPYYYTVTNVIDGDTIQLDNTEVVNFLGVEIDNTYNKNAVDLLRKLLIGKRVWLEYDELDTDDSGRIVAYVYTEDGRFLSAVILAEGYAKAVAVQPNVKYQETLEEVQQKARNAKKGIWSR